MAEREVERRLAAIVSADVVGYTRLMEADEAGTHARLKARFKDLVEPSIDKFGGRVVKLMGDGLPAALQCSLACTHAIENALGTVRVVQRNVKRWRNAEMALRCTAAGELEAQNTFQRLKAYRQLSILAASLEAHMKKVNAEFQMRNSVLPVRAILGETSMIVQDVLNLRKGDILFLQSEVNQPIDVHVGNLKLYQGFPLKKENSMTIRIENIIRQNSLSPAE